MICRPELALLLCCARTSFDIEQRTKVLALLKEEIDWQYLEQAADRHGLLPLLYRNLDHTCAETIPETLLNHLRDRFRKNTISNLLLAAEMLRIWKLFESHDIIAIPFKGPTLALVAYKDIALRQFQDIDLLLRREDVLKAKALLVARGYRPDYELTRAQEAAYLKCDCEYNFKGSIYIELQWEIAPRNYSFAVNDAPLWHRLERIEIEGINLPALPAEDLLLVLCVHGTKHAWTRLSWICDVAELLSTRADLNWQRLIERARHLGGERMLLLGLFLANELLSATLPGEMFEQVKADTVVKQLGAQVVEQLFNPAADSLQVIKHSLFFICARERLSDRVRCRLRMMFAPTIKDLTFVRLPRAFSFVYYLLRPIRLIGKYGIKLLRRFNDKAIHRRGAEVNIFSA